ncbi:hypothetical protein [Salinispora arenicola]|uniref:hypothetical protein n=1 Tax=Salinispora arenicola TaxID=168697 RepID=UPI0027DABC46|nr:hypothetical protein [Salinispora arenicola]
MRRVHRLANSVIVLDEVQALPHAMLAPILDGIRLLERHFGVLRCCPQRPSRASGRWTSSRMYPTRT